MLHRFAGRLAQMERARYERGFTLIELLVVVITIDQTTGVESEVITTRIG